MIGRRVLLRALAALPLSQMQQQPRPARRRIIPIDVIQRFKLEPTRGQFGEYYIGEDGKAYDADDVIAVIFELTSEHWRLKK